MKTFIFNVIIYYITYKIDTCDIVCMLLSLSVTE